MPAYFSLTLDTTPPDINIIAPYYTIPGINTEITIQSNESLAAYQNIYVLDVDGIRHDLIFTHEGDSFIGTWKFNSCAVGIARIYAQLKDDVFNPSNTAVFSINVREGASTHTEINDCSRDIELHYDDKKKIKLHEYIQVIGIDNYHRSIDSDMLDMELDLSDDTRQIEVIT